MGDGWNGGIGGVPAQTALHVNDVFSPAKQPFMRVLLSPPVGIGVGLIILRTIARKLNIGRSSPSKDSDDPVSTNSLFTPLTSIYIQGPGRPPQGFARPSSSPSSSLFSSPLLLLAKKSPHVNKTTPRSYFPLFLLVLYPKMAIRPIFAATHPRACSTAFERVWLFTFLPVVFILYFFYPFKTHPASKSSY